MVQLELSFDATPTDAPLPDAPPADVAPHRPVAQSKAPSPGNLSEAIQRLQEHPTLSHGRRRDLISGLRSIARMTRRNPDIIPATAMALRSIFADASHASIGVTKETWSNLRSLGLAALRQAGVAEIKWSTSRPLSPRWDELRDKLPDIKTRAGLSRFMGWCSADGIEPDQVTAATFAAYYDELVKGTLVQKPSFTVRLTCQLWNTAACNIDGWPQIFVPVPNRSRRYAWSWDRFPSSFQADAEGFLIKEANPNPFAVDYSRPIKPSTVALRRKQILQMATVLAVSGVPPEEITGLACLTHPANAERILRSFYDRRGQKFGYLHQHALLLKTIARGWVGADERQLSALTLFARNLAFKRLGMTEKNRERLRQFDNPQNVIALVSLGRRVMDDLRRRTTWDRQDAERAMLAMAVELLVVAPMRVGTLSIMEEDRHLLTTQSRQSTVTHIVIPPHETKTEVPFEAELPAHTERLLNIYKRRFRPMLAAEPSPWLFPSRQGLRRQSNSFAVRLCHFIKRETGLTMNAHLFRHFAVKLLLDRYPDDIETARRLLGHKNSRTTTQNYAELRTASAFRRYDAILTPYRDGAPAGRLGPQRAEVVR